MNITFAPRGILQIDDARIIYRNFTGAGSKFNREGDRNFAVVIPDRNLTMGEAMEVARVLSHGAVAVIDDTGVEEPFVQYDDARISTLADALTALGWNVKIKPPRDEDDSPFMYLPVKVKFNERGPVVYLKAGAAETVRLDEESIECLDHVDISSVDMDLRPYDWEVNGKTGRTAYLQSICVIQEVDRFAEKYN